MNKKTEIERRLINKINRRIEIAKGICICNQGIHDNSKIDCDCECHR